MFNFFKKPQRDLENMVDDVGTKIDELIRERDSALNDVKRLKEQLLKIETDLRDEEFALDFNVARVFSIERNWHDNLPCTIIGHIVKDSEHTETTREWYFYCSERRHHELIDAFKKHQEKVYSNKKA